MANTTAATTGPWLLIHSLHLIDKILTPRRMQRVALFWGVCIPLRTYACTLGNNLALRGVAAVMAYRWLTGVQKGHIGFFGGRAFWAKDRPLHGALWASYSATGDPAFMWADTVFGALSWLSHNT